MFENLLKKRNKLMYASAYNFFCDELGITKEERERIQITLVKRLRNASGVCYTIYNAPTNAIKKMYIHILDYGSAYGIIDVLAHELVHAKQHLRGEFYYIKRKVPFLFFFKISKWELCHGDQILSETPYFEQKCEQEAFTVANELTLKFIDKINSESKKQIRLTQDENIEDVNIDDCWTFCR